MRFKILFFSAIISLLCFSCSLKQQHVLFEQKGAVTNSAKQDAMPVIHHIKPDDELQIKNLQDPEAFGNKALAATTNQTAPVVTYRVEEDGTVTLPVIGHVAVAGLTANEAEKKIEKLYGAEHLVNPIIDLKVLNLKVHVFGEVKLQGNYPLVKEHTSLIDILAQAGGLTNNAEEKNVKIIRDKTKLIWVDLSNIQTLSDPKIMMQDGDIVYIAQNKRAIRDEKVQNFSTLIQPSLLIFNTALIIYTLFKK